MTATPRPWIFETVDDGDGETLEFTIEAESLGSRKLLGTASGFDDYRRFIAGTIYNNRDHLPPEAFEDTRWDDIEFLRRAVNAHDDLLAACRQFLEHHRQVPTVPISDSDQTCVCGHCARMRAAIAKAEGKTS